MVSATALLEIQNLRVRYPVAHGVFSSGREWVRAVEDVSFALQAGETVGLVGESGCGKTTLGRALVGLSRPTSGRMFFQGLEVNPQKRSHLRKLRREVQMVFQDPLGALSPRFKVHDIVGEGLDIHRLAEDGAARRARVLAALEAAGLDEGIAQRYPHELSGGQRQRVCLARALAIEPKLLILDEPLSALDVSVQAQIVHLLQQLQRQQGLGFLFIAHDLAVVEYLSQRILVMYLGRIVEHAHARALTSKPRHPYTQALLSAVPVLEPLPGRQRVVLSGEPASPRHPPSGCPFHPRCPLADSARCQREVPALREVAPGHWAACHWA